MSPYAFIWSILSAFVYVAGGRTVVVYPETQIVIAIFAWVTRGSATPGVQTGSGRPLERWQVPIVTGEAIAAATVGATLAEGGPLAVDGAEIREIPVGATVAAGATVPGGAHPATARARHATMTHFTYAIRLFRDDLCMTN